MTCPPTVSEILEGTWDRLDMLRWRIRKLRCRIFGHRPRRIMSPASLTFDSPLTGDPDAPTPVLKRIDSEPALACARCDAWLGWLDRSCDP